MGGWSWWWGWVWSVERRPFSWNSSSPPATRWNSGRGKVIVGTLFFFSFRNGGHYQVHPSTCCAAPGYDWRPVSWTVLHQPSGDNRRGTGFATATGREKRWPRGTPSTREDLWGGGGVVEWGSGEGEGREVPWMNIFSTSSGQTSLVPSLSIL